MLYEVGDPTQVTQKNQVVGIDLSGKCILAIRIGQLGIYRGILQHLNSIQIVLGWEISQDRSFLQDRIWQICKVARIHNRRIIQENGGQLIKNIVSEAFALPS